MNNLIKKTEKYLHCIFIGSLLLTYLGLYIYYRDTLFIAGGAILDWNYVHFNNVRLNYDLWIRDVGGTSGVDNFYLVSVSYWIPILISEFIGVSTIVLARVQALLLPIVILILFYKVTSLVYEKVSDRIFPCLLLALGSWDIFKMTLSGSASLRFFSGYYAQDFFVLFVISLYFFLKKNAKYCGLSIFLGILVHPSLGVVAGGFFLFSWLFIYKDSNFNQLILFICFIVAGVITELLILDIVFPPELPRVSPEILWEALMNDSHMNFFDTHRSIFFMYAFAILFLATTAYATTGNNTVKQLIIMGGVWLILMFAVYLMGLLGKNPDIMRLQPLRFSQPFYFIIFLGVSFPNTRIKGLAFTAFMAGLFGVHSWLDPWPAQDKIIPSGPAMIAISLTAGVILCILLVPSFYSSFQKFPIKKFKFFFIILIIGITLFSPLLRWTRAVDERVFKIDEAIKYASLNIQGDKTFLPWGERELMPEEIIRTFTQSPTINIHVQGMFQYNALKLIHEDDIKKTMILLDVSPKSLLERRIETIKAMRKPFIGKYSDYYKNVYGVTHVIVFKYPGKIIESVGELLFDNEMVQIFAL